MVAPLTRNSNSIADDAAQVIYQEVLDSVSEATLHYDENVLRDAVQVPMKLTTLNEEFVIEEEQDWLDSVKGFHRFMVSMGVNHFIRIAFRAEFLSANYIEGCHVTYIMRNAEKVVPDYECRAALTRVDGRWRLNTLETTMENDRWPVVSPRVSQSRKAKFQEVIPETDARRKSTSPMSIYQTYLDRLTLTNLEDDFEGWCALCDFPHTVHIDHVDQVIEGPAGIKPFFDMLTEQINLLGITRIRRHATRAEFISPTQICGYHTTTLGTEDEVKLGPFDCRYILTRVGTRWRMSSGQA